MGFSSQDLYLKLPSTIQNAAITAFGMKEYRLRYDRNLQAPFDILTENGDFTFEQTRAFQRARFDYVLTHAATYVPYYRKLFKKLGVSVRDITLDNFTGVIPILEKSAVISDPSQFISEAKLKTIKLFTSGTSGSPLPIKCSIKARAANYAFFRKVLREYGCDVRDRSATFAGRTLFNEHEARNFWRKDYFNNTLLMSSYRISEESLPRYISALEAWQPRYIDSYPSAIAELATYINDKRIHHSLNLAFVLTSSETLTAPQREQIEKAFGCPIVDHYGCTEMAVCAHATGNDRYHMETLYSLIEFEPLPNSDYASLICTGLLNEAMPLLRYRIGDTVSDAQSYPEQPFFQQSFKSIIGREDDLIVTPEGNKIGRLDPAFKGVNGIRLAQIIQTDIDRLKVLVVPTSE